MLYELILINEIEQRAKIIFLSVDNITYKHMHFCHKLKSVKYRQRVLILDLI